MGSRSGWEGKEPVGPATSSLVASYQHLISRCPWTLLEDSISRGNTEQWASHWHFGASTQTLPTAPSSPPARAAQAMLLCKVLMFTFTLPFELQRHESPTKQTQPHTPTSPSCCWAQYGRSIEAAQSQDRLLCSCFLSPNPLFWRHFPPPSPPRT